ncbi:MAG: CheR family methyltransferase [Pseudomonadota bacterium]
MNDETKSPENSEVSVAELVPTDSHTTNEPLGQLTDVSHVIGIGASAGGLQPLEELFRHLDVDTGAAFVVIQHLSPDFKSLMQELLHRHTSMTVVRVDKREKLHPNTVYLIPPKNNLKVVGDFLELEERDTGADHGPNFPIDIFLVSLAKAFAERAVAVILSGTGSDGTRGVRAVSEAHGFVIAQEPQTAQFDGMPMSALSTGVVNSTFVPSRIGVFLSQYISRFDAPVFNSSALYEDPEQKSIRQILDILTHDSDVDFSQYKLATVQRRIERRLLASDSASLSEYTDLLTTSDTERSALRNELLINVTAFFRDTSAWELLKSDFLPRVIDEIDAGDILRVWVAACSTGEEAYSIAILIEEVLDTLNRRRDVKIFATDVDQNALDRASLGRYTESSVIDVPQPLRDKYFERVGDDYVVRRKIREMVIFANHNLAKDPPFTRMHLTTCRNVLIYMQNELQKHVLQVLHFSLRAEGVLFLGAAESVSDLTDEFSVLSSKWNIYRKLRDVRLAREGSMVGVPPKWQALSRGSVAPSSGRENQTHSLIHDSYRALMRAQCSTCVIANAQQQILHIVGDARDYLNFPEGEATHEISKLVNRSVSLPLSTAIHRARKEQEPILYSGIKYADSQGGATLLNLRVSYHLATRTTPDYFMIIFEKVDSNVSSSSVVEFDAESHSGQRIQDLENELQHTRENLQATIEELETTNEEHQATNEELLASNEELQSTNEELHSVNEELYTVNSEYQSKIQELTELNHDIDNLLKSTGIGVIFLDENLCIRKFTPAATKAVHLVTNDVGRPFADFSHNLDYRNLNGDLRRVLSLGDAIEKETKTLDGVAVLVRLNPYKTGTDLAIGVVISLISISELKSVEESLAATEDRYRRLFESEITGIFVGNIETATISEANDSFVKMLGYQHTALPIEINAISRSQLDKPTLLGSLLELKHSGAMKTQKVDLLNQAGEILPALVSATLLDSDTGDFVCFVHDNTLQNQVETSLTAKTMELERTNRNLEQFAYVASHDLQEPLRSIEGFSSLLRDRFSNELGSDGADYLARIQESSDRMQVLIESLLAYSRVQTQGKSFSPVSALTLLEQTAKNDAAKISTEIKKRSHDIPQILGDSGQLKNLFEYLFENSVKFRSDAPPTLIITVGVNEHNQLEVCFEDNGIGINPQYADRIFTIFQRLHTREEYPGTGIGLALCKRLVDRHNGAIWVDTHFTNGARIKMVFPVIEPNLGV